MSIQTTKRSSYPAATASSSSVTLQPREHLQLRAFLHQSLLPTSEEVRPEAKRRKKRRLDDTQEEGQHKRRKSQRIAAGVDHQRPSRSPDNTASKAARIQWKNRRLDDAEENAEHKKSRVDLVETDSPRRSVACVKALVELSMRLEFMI